MVAMPHEQLMKLLARLRPRDLEVVRALVVYPWLGQSDIASLLQMKLGNLRSRAKHSYAVLGVEDRVHLVAEYIDIFHGEPNTGTP